jgi:hypothetical protein
MQVWALLIVKYFSLVAIAILLMTAPCSADAQGSVFRNAFACPDRGPLSVCIFGTIPSGKQVTVVARDWKSSARPKEKFPNTDFDNGAKTITRLEVIDPPPPKALLIAILVAADTVEVLPLKEVQDEAAVRRITLYLENAKDLKIWSDLHDATKTRLLRLSPTILLSETFLTPPGSPENGGKVSIGCDYCEMIPMLIGQDLIDLFAEIRSPNTCGSIASAFAISGRPYVMSSASSCESDSFSATLIHDLSGKQPKRQRIGGF